MTAFRTVRNGHRRTRWSDWVWTALATWLLPTVVGRLLLVSGGVDQPGVLLLRVQVIGIALVVAPLVTWFLVPIGLAIAALALRLGWAGWASTLLLALLFATVLMLAISLDDPRDLVSRLMPLSFAIDVTLLHAGLMWGSLRWLRPEALAAR